ncbi:hypothetical protein MTBBW1_1430043 [Desulfamplus magnetovallimortis]|uniref:Uncharacterized protein n=1 Tax=Desulfamplus magnetovallimortis TaxID=1246637 RepID=A0A1W1H875_9BACT|nr:hypothetical protein MTBBW1_1430043 [Desulfamplus magnetovallimortis]
MKKRRLRAEIDFEMGIFDDNSEVYLCPTPTYSLLFDRICGFK